MYQYPAHLALYTILTSSSTWARPKHMEAYHVLVWSSHRYPLDGISELPWSDFQFYREIWFPRELLLESFPLAL